MKLWEYVERRFQRLGRTQDAFPTVRQAAHRFNVPQHVIESAVEDSECLHLTTHFVSPTPPLGEWSVESLCDESEKP